jgi:hypothetical protein
MRYNKDIIKLIFHQFVASQELGDKVKFFIVDKYIPKKLLAIRPDYPYRPEAQATADTTNNTIVLYKSYVTDYCEDIKDVILTIGHELAHLQDNDIESHSEFSYAEEGRCDYIGYVLAKRAGFKLSFADVIKSLWTTLQLCPDISTRVKHAKEYKRVYRSKIEPLLKELK